MIKKMNPAIFRICMFLMLFLVPLFKGCANGGTEIGNPNFPPGPGLGTFSSDEQLRAYILDQYSKNVLPDYSYGRVTLDDGAEWDNDGTGQDDAAEGDAPPASEPDDYSDTNVQEEGVDEADIVKNNGRYIFIARGDRVTIVDTEDPSSMTEAGAIAVVDGLVDSLYLYGKYLVILFTVDGYRNYWNYPGAEAAMDIGYCYWVPVNSKAGVRIVDVSDPAAPATINETLIDGNIISSRRIDEKLYLIQQFLPDLPPFDYTYDHNTKNMDDVVSSNQKKLESVPLDDLVPGYFNVDKNGNESEEIQLVNYDHFYKPTETSGGSVVTITTFDLDDPTKPIESTGVIADAHTIYASTSALYISSTRWNDTNYQEEEYSELYSTYLFKFSFTENGVVAAGTGSVSGKILNQFSLGEYEDVLRIATTNGETWWGESVTNSVYCLKAEEGNLNVIGKIEGIAKGETIYAARFIGKRGYLVTFVQVDPLFTLDLSDPYHPAIAGELKVPGYSNYIHPLSEDYLLTIGQDVETYGGSVLNKGIQLCIFDIRDFSNPTLLHQEIIGDMGTYSEAQYNHKAFTYWASKNLLAIPVNLYEKTEGAPPYEYGNYKYSGLYVYRVSSETGFSPLGTLKTNSDTEWYYSSWTRGLFIDDHVFAVDQDAVRSAEYEAIDTTITTLTLTQTQGEKQ